jgi:Rhodopirellula transposase DDE domain
LLDASEEETENGDSNRIRSSGAGRKLLEEKELIGDFKNSGTEWCEKEQPIEVKMHDFVDLKLGKAIPYGIDDLTSNQGWVNVGIDQLASCD